MVYTYEYDTVYHGPAMPIVEIEIGAAGEESQNRFALRALVDPGADATMIPVRYLNRLGARVIDRRRMRSSANISYPVDIFTVTLKVGPFEHTAVQVIGNRQSEDVILGRDILNQLIVTLNRLAGVVEVSQ